jgi:hypothetical protein
MNILEEYELTIAHSEINLSRPKVQRRREEL